MIKSDSTDITWIQAQPYCFQHWMTISGNLHCANKLTTQTKFFTWRNNKYTYNFKLILILKDNAWSHSSSIKKKKHTVKWTVVSGDVQIISIPLKANVDV